MLALYWHTVRYLKPVQILGRLWYFLYHPKPSLRDAPNIRETDKIWAAPQWRKAEILSATTFTFLNERRELNFPNGWHAKNVERLWLYNLHYFNDLTAYGAEQAVLLHTQMIQDWILGNPPTKGTGWEPYPLSLRIVNWIKWSLAGNRLSNTARHSLAVQVRYLRRRLEFHLLGNHLFENGKALVFAGLFFEGPEAESWYQTGLKVLTSQLEEQVLSDGGHFERSPMYHALILEGLLDIIHLHQVFGITFPSSWRVTASQMLLWIQATSHPDGEVSFFNDTTFNAAPRLHDLAKYSLTIGVPLEEAPSGSLLLGPSGFARLESRGAVLLADVGTVGPSYLPGHAHAETLSFELSVSGKRIVVNSGISCYGTTSERIRQRSTPAHSTLIVDGQNSSVVWSGFRVAQRACAKLRRFKNGSTSILSASHNGYKRLRGRPIHIRTWQLDDHSLEVTDQVEGNSDHEIEIVFHFHPEISVHLLDGRNAIALSSAERDIRIELDPSLSWRVAAGSWHPAFGLSQPNVRLQGSRNALLPQRAVTRFSWGVF
jgi:uncharacterized heparinase superfamily protein